MEVSLSLSLTLLRSLCFSPHPILPLATTEPTPPGGPLGSCVLLRVLSALSRTTGNSWSSLSWVISLLPLPLPPSTVTAKALLPPFLWCGGFAARCSRLTPDGIRAATILSEYLPPPISRSFFIFLSLSFVPSSRVEQCDSQCYGEGGGMPQRPLSGARSVPSATQLQIPHICRSPLLLLSSSSSFCCLHFLTFLPAPLNPFSVLHCCGSFCPRLIARGVFLSLSFSS